MPTSNTQAGHPFRMDLLQMLEKIEPAFIRFPGGTYVDGVEMDNRYNWETTVGPVEQRPGHFDDIWGYWSTDGLGFYEYLLLCEVVHAEPVWVLWDGVSLTSSIPTNDIQPCVQSGLNSLEFAMGSVNTYWGGVRASMGHPKPFQINYVAIGNEDSGMPYYATNYLAFYEALKIAYPNITLIANAPMLDQAPTDMYDYHVYTDPYWFMANQFYWDQVDRSTSPLVFNSEYACTGDGWVGLGNLNASLGEAVWMTGLERNSDLVQLASYAPLFVNTNFRDWNPDAIVFDTDSVYGTPSYWTQVLFSTNKGVLSLNSVLGTNTNNSIGFSATCVDLACTQLSLKVVNTASVVNNLQLNLMGAQIASTATITTITGSSPSMENTFSTPTAIIPVSGTLLLTPLGGGQNGGVMALAPWSINVVTVDVL